MVVREPHQQRHHARRLLALAPNRQGETSKEASFVSMPWEWSSLKAVPGSPLLWVTAGRLQALMDHRPMRLPANCDLDMSLKGMSEE